MSFSSCDDYIVHAFLILLKHTWCHSFEGKIKKEGRGRRKTMKQIKKSGLIAFIVAAILIVASVLLAGIGGIANFIPGGRGYGVRASVNYYLAGFAFNFTSKWSFVVLVVDVIVLLALIVTVIDLIHAKKTKLLPSAGFIAVGVAYLPYLVILGYGLMANKAWTPASIFVVVFCFAMDIVGSFIMFRLIVGDIISTKKEELITPTNDVALSEDQIRVIVREEIEKFEAEKADKEVVKEEPVVEILTKEDVQKIADETVEKALEKHLDDKHVEPVVAPVEEVKEEAPVAEEEVVEDADEKLDEEPEEGEEENVIEEGSENDPFAALRNKRRASFETRVKNSDYDIRHKYYDLRDYLKSYGVKNRISIPGDTFSAHRKRYAFITISGKHIKVYFAANPDDYKDTPIPVERHTTKKYEDLPLLFNIRSDLSYRRALKLVDDMMAKDGFVREDKPIKNTQNPDQK